MATSGIRNSQVQHGNLAKQTHFINKEKADNKSQCLLEMVTVSQPLKNKFADQKSRDWEVQIAAF